MRFKTAHSKEIPVPVGNIRPYSFFTKDDKDDSTVYMVIYRESYDSKYATCVVVGRFNSHGGALTEDIPRNEKVYRVTPTVLEYSRENE